MSSISQLGSSIGGIRNRGDFGEYGSLSEKKESLQVSQSKNLELSLTTKEGDTVTLSAGSFTDFSALSYDKNGRISNGNQNVSANISSREITLASGSQFTFSVKGSLSDDEMDDIENMLATLDEVINKMSTGEMDDAAAKALEMDQGFDTIDGFEADLTYSSSYNFSSEISENAYSSGEAGRARPPLHGRGNPEEMLHRGSPQGIGRGFGLDRDEIGMPEAAKDSSSRLMEMMLKELDKLKEEGKNISSKAKEPVDQLLSHHLDMLTQQNQDVQKDNNVNSMIEELKNAKKGMADKFNKMIPEAESFSKIASSFFNNV